MPSILGALFIATLIWSVAYRRSALPWVLSAAVPFTATSGLTIGGQSVVMYPLVAIVVVLVAVRGASLRSMLDTDLSATAGLRPLLAFGAWAVVVTAASPMIFAGLKVLDPRDGIDVGVERPASLAFTVSNVAQPIYLLLGIATVVAIGKTAVSPRVPALGFAIGTITSSLRALLPESLQKQIFDNSLNVEYTAGTFEGVERMRGVFSEPSALGAFSVAAAVFFFATASTATGARRPLALLMGIWAATNAFYSVSGGAIVSGLIVAGIVAVKCIFGWVSGRQRMSAGTFVLLFAGAPVALVTLPSAYSFVALVLDGKSDSTSFENRSTADAMSYALGSQTAGVGVGVGSNRPSSFAASLFSTTGCIGVALFAVATLTIILFALRLANFQPAAWALISIVISKIVSGPDISDPPMWFLLAVCASGAWTLPSPAGLSSDPATPPFRPSIVFSPENARRPSASQLDYKTVAP